MKLLRNEIGATINSEVIGKAQPRVNDRRRGRVDNLDRRSPNDYRWNWDYKNFYAEVFIRIPQDGYFTVQINNDRISSATGRFRFFDLSSGTNIISIYENGYLIYKSRINVKNSYRMVLDFFANRGLYLLDAYPLQTNRNGSYGDVWNDIWNDPYNNNRNTNWDPYNNSNNGSYNRLPVMGNRDFESFLLALNRERFDDGKLQLMQQQLRQNSFTTGQISLLMKSLAYDKNRLDIAKAAYNNCADRENYFRLSEAFQFESTAREFKNYVGAL